MAPPNYQCFVLNALCESCTSTKKMEKAYVLSYDRIRWYDMIYIYIFCLSRWAPCQFKQRECCHVLVKRMAPLQVWHQPITTDPLWGSCGKKWSMYPGCLILFAQHCFHKGQSVDCLFGESIRKVVYTLKSITYFVNLKQTNVPLPIVILLVNIKNHHDRRCQTRQLKKNH